MTFYDKCLNLRDKYLKSPNENYYKIQFIKGLISIAFYNPEYPTDLDTLTLGVPLSLKCRTDEKTATENLTSVLKELGYSNFYIDTTSFHISSVLEVTIKE